MFTTVQKKHLNIIKEQVLRLNRDFLDRGATLADIKLAYEYNKETKKRIKRKKKKKPIFYIINKKFILLLLLSLLYAIEGNCVDYIYKQVQGTRCLVPNNYLIWEFTRPVSNCDFCRGIDSALILNNLTRSQFVDYAYSSRPIIVKKAATNWLASKVFSLQFFRSLYDNINGAYDEDCQFLPFRSNFVNLKEVLYMNDRRAVNLNGEEAWYVGWKNCHPQVVEIMNQFYETPHFLPKDAEIPNTNYIFLGYDKGADMHVSFFFFLIC